MDNPFFENNGPYKLAQILKELNLNLDQKNNNLNVTDIKIY